MLQAEPHFAEVFASPKARMATAEEVVSSMEQHGVDTSVVLGTNWCSPERSREANDYLLESAARHRGRLVAFCGLPPRGTEAMSLEVERCAAGGARGMGELRPDVMGLDMSDETATTPLAEALERHRLILLLHTSEPVGHPYPGKAGLTPEAVYPFLLLHPNLTVVCAHWGGGLPFYALMPEVARALERTYFDTSASPFLYRPQIYSHAIQMVGEAKVLFGSDFPLMPQHRPLSEIRSLSLPQRVEHLVLGGNATKLLGL
ncbi:MAG: amidohydrolase family protein [Dehalococcoidia bacterium]|nr:amidohydrolase family protein [Dehalococcoidia bacterium]MDP6783085.1 amidohydrolase family protein [Dehalococcoidia bacterium]